jgi:tetratricopeptide (TPR) repeat protein
MKRKVRVFLASPSDLMRERVLFREAIAELNEGFGDGADVKFESLGWEESLASTGRRVQSAINELVDNCDVFILALHRRWGREAPDAAPYSSYSEEEFHRALERWKRSSKPDIFVFLKRVDAASEGDPGPQLRKVMEFRRHLEESKQVLYRLFDGEQSFVEDVDRHLRAYARGDLPKPNKRGDNIVLPIDALREVEEARKLASRESESAKEAHDSANASLNRFLSLQLQVAEDAALLARDGSIEYARQKFTDLIVDSEDIRILHLSYEFFYRTGDLQSAAVALEKWLALCGRESQTATTSAALGNLGNLYWTRGDLDRAEELYQESLTIEVALDRKEGMASAYGNLGVLYRTRGDDARAEEMYNKSLAINKELGRREGLAGNYDDLGNLFASRGVLDRAEELFHESLAINESLGRKQSIARDYGNLGNVFLRQGDMDRAEEMYDRSLALNKALGHKDGMAAQYGNIGHVYRLRGDRERAEEMYRSSLALFQELGSPSEREVAGWLHGLQTQGSEEEDDRQK